MAANEVGSVGSSQRSWLRWQQPTKLAAVIDLDQISFQIKNFLVFSFQSLSGGMVYAADLGSVASGVEVRVLSKAFFENTSKASQPTKLAATSFFAFKEIFGM